MNKLVDRYIDILHEEGFDTEPAPPLVDHGDAILDLDARLTQLEQQVQQIALNTLAMAQHIRDLRRQSTAPPKPAILLPDRFN